MNIWTDGSCLGNPGPGAWAFLVPETSYHEVGGELHTTNNRMELTAVLQALRYAAANAYSPRVTVWSDSLWAISTADKLWNARANLDLLEQVWAVLHTIRQKADVRFKHIEGHSGHPHNDAVDRLAQAEAKRMRSLL